MTSPAGEALADRLLGPFLPVFTICFWLTLPPRDNWTGCCILWYAMEKEPDYVVEPNGDDTPADEHLGKYGAREGAKASEAKDIYGDIQTAEEYGYVSRG